MFFFSFSFMNLRRCDDDILVNEIRNGKISFAFEGMEKFPRNLVEVLRNDITYLDLSMNNIQNFAFLRGFKHLKSLIVDENIRMEIDSFPSIDSLELFYANKCNVEFPRSFIFRVSVIFPHLKYFSMMTNPMMKRACLESIWRGREHRMRMFAIFMNPNLIHYNDKEISEEDREHSKNYHKYLGPIDCNLSKFKTLPDTDDIRKILPVHILSKTNDDFSMEIQDNNDRLDENLAAFRISAYFASQQDDSISLQSFISSDKNVLSTRNSPNGSIYTNTTDEGIIMEPSEHLFD
jgi:hypothetical protein